jgi:aspartyl-tRNA(Asn)/glutamyl-tRNA(Gln) amidotransferase subunit A
MHKMQSFIAIADAIRNGELSAREVLEQSLSVIDAKNPELNAFIMLDEETARAAADDIDRRISAGEDPGKLAGVPIGVKDIENCIGFPTTQGSLLLKDAPRASADSIHVARLRAAGAVIVGKTNTPEFGMDGATHNKLWGVTGNPWNPAMTPGGSSGGSSSAVASGMVPLATATDAGGSTRQPAAYTGTIGLHPSHGRIPKANGFSNWACHGAITRSVLETARYLDVVSGPDDHDRQSLPPPGLLYEEQADTFDVAGLRGAWSSDLGYAVVETEIIEICERAARKLMAAAALTSVERECHIANAYMPLALINLWRMKSEMELEGTYAASLPLLAEQSQGWLRRMGDLNEQDIADAWKVIYQLESDMADLFNDIDVLFTPATACSPYAADAPIPQVIDGRDASNSGGEPFGPPANICWNPSISVPAGLTAAGLPVGLQITVRRHHDHVALRLARIWEQAQPWSYPWDRG